MLNGKMTRKVSTKQDADGDEKQTDFTVDFSNCSEDVVKAMAFAYLTVKRQGAWRRKGIPAKEEIAATNFAPGSRAVEPVTVDTIAARAETLSPEQRAELLRKLQELA